MTRTVFLNLLLGLPAVSLIIAAVSAGTLKSFQKRCPKIVSESQLVDFKRLVKFQMYLALVSMPFLALPIPLFFVGMFLDQLQLFRDGLYAALPSAAVFGAARLLGGLEQAVRAMPVGNEALKPEKERVSAAWTGRALPDW